MSGYASILAAVVALLQSITDHGAVVDHEPLSIDQKAFIDALRDPHNSARIYGWTVAREKSPERWLTSGQTHREYVFRLRGCLTVDESAGTANTFQAAIETICDTFRTRANYTLGGTANDGIDPVQVEIVQGRIIHGALCHYAELTVTARELLLLT